MRHLALLTLLLGAVLSAAVPLPSEAQQEPPRPRLPRGADPNDWESYYTHAVTRMRGWSAEADAGFYWASRLDPSRAEPYFARWVTFWLRDFKRWERYLDGARNVIESPEVAAAEDLRFTAYTRNPFVHQGLTLVLYDLLPGQFRDDPVTRAWLAYGKPEHERAARLFAVAIDLKRKERNHLHILRASAFVAMARYDSALAALGTMREEMERRERGATVVYYDSKEFLDYGTGLLYLARGDARNARTALERSVVENAGFHPAHAALGSIALAQRDMARALGSYAQAVEIAPGDGWVRYGYGHALLSARRYEDAVRELSEAVRLEPHHARAYFALATALEAAGDTTAAAQAYRDYVKRAPRNEETQLAYAQERLKELGGG